VKHLILSISISVGALATFSANAGTFLLREYTGPMQLNIPHLNLSLDGSKLELGTEPWEVRQVCEIHDGEVIVRTIPAAHPFSDNKEETITLESRRPFRMTEAMKDQIEDTDKGTMKHVYGHHSSNLVTIVYTVVKPLSASCADLSAASCQKRIPLYFRPGKAGGYDQANSRIGQLRAMIDLLCQ
jgi:hypothetical protein